MNTDGQIYAAEDVSDEDAERLRRHFREIETEERQKMAEALVDLDELKANTQTDALERALKEIEARGGATL